MYIYEHMLVSLTLIEPLISQFYINLCVCYRTHNSTSQQEEDIAVDDVERKIDKFCMCMLACLLASKKSQASLRNKNNVKRKC